MLTSDELSEMRAEAALTLPETASISRRTMTSDGAGGFTPSGTTSRTAACRVCKPTDVQMEIYGGRIGNRQAVVLKFGWTTDVASGDDVTVGGMRYEVIGVMAGTWPVVKIAMGVTV